MEHVSRFRERDVAMIVFVAAIFILAIVYSVYSASTIDNNVSTANVIASGDVYASTTVQATGNGLFYTNLSAGASTNTPTTTFNVTGSGYLTGGLGVGFATTGAGQIHAKGLGVFESRLGVNGTTSPSVEFGVTGSGLVSEGFGVGYATTSGLKVSGLAALNDRLAVNGTTSPYQELVVRGDIAGESAATTTLALESTGTNGTGCIELKTGGGTLGPQRWVRIYPGGGQNATSTTGIVANAIIIMEPGRCQ